MRRQSGTARRRVRRAIAFGALFCFFATFAAPASADADEISFSAVETLTSAGAVAPTIASDQSDYAPGSVVTLTGAGWQPGEPVEITVNDETGRSWIRTVQVTADADGRIADSFTLPNWFVATYSVAATGSSGTATTSFTDASLSARAAPAGVSFSLTAQGFTTSTCATPVNGSNGNPATSSVTAGTTSAVSFGSAPFVKLTAGAASAPAGATFASWSGPSSFNSTSASICVATPSGGTDHVYTATYAGGTTPPTPQNQTISFVAPTGKTYGDADFAAGATASSGLPVSYAASTPGTCSIVGAAIHIAAAGTCSITASQPGNASYNPAPPVTRSFAIAAKPVTGSYATQSRVYDGTTLVSITGRALSGIVGADAVSLAGGTAAFADKTVGSGKQVNGTSFTLAGAAAGNYVLASTSIASTGTITAAPLTAAFTAMDKVYDGTTAAAISGRSLTGVLAGDTVTVGSGNAGFADASAGIDKTVTGAGFTLSGADAGNYELSSVPVTTLASITRLGITGSFTAAGKVYDASAAAEVLTRTVAGAIGGDEVALTGGTAAFADAAAGTDKPVTLAGASLVGSDAGNYTLTGVAEAQASIERLGITGTFTAAGKTYDGTVAADLLSRSLIGVLGGDEVELTGGTAAFADAAAGADKLVTLAGASLVGSDAGNYTLTGVAEAQASIERFGISGAFTAAGKVYDGGTAAEVLSRTLVGALAGDDVELSGGTAAFEDASAGADKTVTLAGASLAGAAAGNYMLSGVATAQASIERLAITGAFGAADKIYDGETGAEVLSRSLVGALDGDDVELAGGTAAFEDASAGLDKSVTLTGASLAGAAAGNYALSGVATARASIERLGISGAFAAADRVYDGETGAEVLSRSLVGVLDGDDVELTGGSAAFADRNAGADKTVTLTGASLAGAAAGNYALTGVATARASIERLGISGAFTAADKIYDGDTDAEVLSRSLVGVLDGDDVDLTGGSAAFENANAGLDKSVTLSEAALSGADAGNYSLTAVSAALASISKKPLTVTGPSPAAIVYGDELPTLAPAYDGFVAGEAAGLLAVAPTCDLAPDYHGAGSYAVRCFGGEDENYGFVYADGSLTVATKGLTGSFSALDKVYDGITDAEATAHALQGLVGSDSVQLQVGDARFEDEDAGERKTVNAELGLAGEDAFNYHLTSATATAFAAITRKPLTIDGAQAVSRDYDGTIAATVGFGSATLVSPVTGDDVSIDDSGYSASFATKHAGAVRPVTVRGVELAGGDAANYSLAQPSGLSAEIRRLAITGSFTTPASRVYDGGTAAAVLSRSVHGAVAGDAVALSGGAAAFDTKDVGTGKTVTLTGAALAGGDAGNYTLSSVATAGADITKATLTVTAHDKAMTLNGTVPALTWSIAGFVAGESVGASSGVTGAPACSTATGTAPGAFDIACTAGTLAAANYAFAFVKGTLTVSYALTACLGSAGHAILQPIDVDGSSVFRQGSTVPAKFRVCDARGASIGASGVVTSFRLASTSVGVDGPIDEAVVSTTPDTAFRWSATDQQWIFNVNTKSLVANRTYNYEISLNDGSKILFRFGLR